MAESAAAASAQGRRSLTLGTAGHIDHGKSALVEALSGTRTDRLAEERRRGISIELGFAALDLPDGARLSLVDVPGHEALVRTMIAGAGAIDAFCLVIAADDGPMPQTLEHLAVLRALGVERGVVAISKVDLVARDRRAAALQEVAELVPGAPVVAVSARTGQGVGELREALAAVAEAVGREPSARSDTILHADRVFSLPGPGTIATGTLLGGPLARGDELRALPGGAELRVRSLESHDRSTERTGPGARVAVAVSGSDRARLTRGLALVPAASPLRASFRLDCELLGPLGAGELDGERLQIHAGTRESPARAIALGERHVQLRLESELVARPFDRVVVRRIAPVATLGGARVIDPAPRRHGASPELLGRLEDIASGSPAGLLRRSLSESGRVAIDPAGWSLGLACGVARRRFADATWREAAAAIESAGDARLERDALVVPGETPTPPPVAAGRFEPGALERRVLELVEEGGGEPPSHGVIAERLDETADSIRAAVSRLVGAGLLARLGRDLAISPDELARISGEALASADADGVLTLPGVRDRLATSRRYAQALLEHLDAHRVTVRRGDRHVVRRSGR